MFDNIFVLALEQKILVVIPSPLEVVHNSINELTIEVSSVVEAIKHAKEFVELVTIVVDLEEIVIHLKDIEEVAHNVGENRYSK